MGVAGSVVPTGPRWQRTRQVARFAAIGTGATAAAFAAATGVLLGQARQARRTIPMAQAPPPRCDGVYGPRFPGRPLTLVILGDSSAAGYGVHRRRETPGGLLGTGLSRRLRRPVRVHRFAVVGALSAGLKPQVESALETAPDVAVIMVGGNDVTNRSAPGAAVRHLVDAVRTLRAAGCEVVVGTCPDLGAIRPIQPPLRWVARRWSRQLAAAQTVAVVEAGGWTVSLGDLIGPRFTADPVRMFAWDRFHPSAQGYAAVAAALLPTVLAALGTGQERLPLTHGEGVRSLPQAAQEAAHQAGTEVSGTEVSGRERGPAGRWAQLRRRHPASAATMPRPGTTAESPTVEGLS
ncbi:MULTISPECIES: SGNH/GDSL hydrolase family protein [Micromonospora]|uniref:Lysophospholipase L1 n=1 Tax=Micromonospora yangpuensis TaxID=683228 RepID=A0A1C6U6X0_9ACTN|nr:SGNH/GDSL hydrolase family protein [Micromonospora yangpuensis]GGL90483.1 lipase [Micromonospora yangpuensis]SCL49772.1 Lysophospholipase L1 [Micromonospora yangpuensis]